MLLNLKYVFLKLIFVYYVLRVNIEIAHQQAACASPGRPALLRLVIMSFKIKAEANEVMSVKNSQCSKSFKIFIFHCEINNLYWNIENLVFSPGCRVITKNPVYSQLAYTGVFLDLCWYLQILLTTFWSEIMRSLPHYTHPTAGILGKSYGTLLLLIYFSYLTPVYIIHIIRYEWWNNIH